MPNTMRYTVLPVGQGSGTLIQVLDGGGVPIETSLIDLGSLGWSKQTGKPSADVVIAELKRMATPTLDALFLSHSDSDHTNLLRRVLDAFDTPRTAVPTKPVLRINQYWFGGDAAHYKKRSKNILDEVFKYRPLGALTNRNAIGVGVSSWDGATDAHPAVPLRQTAGGVGFWLLYGNGPSTGVFYDDDGRPTRKGSKGYLRNVVSLVLVVRYGTTTVRNLVALGDATGLSLAGAATKLIVEDPDLAPVLTMSLPHHGSATTTYDMLGVSSDGVTADEVMAEVLETFLGNTRPESITASAGEDHHHKHPSYRVVQTFGAYLETGMYTDPGLAAGQHYYTSYYELNKLALAGSAATTTWPPTSSWYTGRTDKDAFTIDYYRPPTGVATVPNVFPPNATVMAAAPPPVAARPRTAGWAYEISADGATVRMVRVVDRFFTSAQALAVLDELHGGLQPDRFVFVPSADEVDPEARDRVERRLRGVAPPAAVATVPGVPTPATASSTAPGLRRVRQIP